MIIKSIKKDYGQTSKIVVYNKSVDISPPVCKTHMLPVCQICWTRKVNPVPSPSSLMRSKTSITDYTLANKFDLFATFTFDPSLVDSFDVNLAKSKLTLWLSNVRQRTSPDLKYLWVAELHKSGRVHFHALIKNYNGLLTDSGKTKNQRPLLNMPGWIYGFSTAIKIDNLEKVSSYMQKYITKDMLKIGNKKRFATSRNLIKPEKTYNINIQEEIYSRPLFVLDQVTMENYKIYKTIKNPEKIQIKKPKENKNKKDDLYNSH